MVDPVFNEGVINASLDDLMLKHFYILLIEIENSLADYHEKVLKNITPSNVQIKVKLGFLFNHAKPYLANDLNREDYEELVELINSRYIDDLGEGFDKLNLWFFNKKSRVIL